MECADSNASIDNISRKRESAVDTETVSKINQKISAKSTNQSFFVVCGVI